MRAYLRFDVLVQASSNDNATLSKARNDIRDFDAFRCVNSGHAVGGCVRLQRHLTESELCDGLLQALRRLFMLGKALLKRDRAGGNVLE